VPDLVLGGGNLGGALTETFKNNKTKVTGSLFAAPGFWECFDGGLDQNTGVATGTLCLRSGGTSIVPPQYATILAIINQKTAISAGQLINPTVTSSSATTGSSTADTNLRMGYRKG
jgi:hypothetical protein